MKTSFDEFDMYLFEAANDDIIILMDYAACTVLKMIRLLLHTLMQHIIYT